MSVENFGVAAGALQIFVPSYGLRLIRRFGTSRVGWFVVISFISLMALHLLEPMGPSHAGFGPQLMLNCVYAIGSVLLLIGMGHIETLFSQSERSRSKESELSSHYQACVQRETSGLARANAALQQEIARCKHAEAVLRESESQYRFVFTENPQPMWILDLRECRFIGVNKAALRLYGYTPEEFMRLTPQDLLAPNQVEAFTQDVKAPRTRLEARTRWQHYRNDQTLLEVEVAERDFNYAGSPARLVVLTDISQQLRRETEVFQTRKMEMIGQFAGGVANQLNGMLKVIEERAALLHPMMPDETATAHLQEISQATAHGNSLALQMLSAGGGQLMQARPLDLNRLIGNLNLVLRRFCGDNVMLQSQCGPNPLPIMADPQVLEQILLALVKNARDAISGKGIVIISSGITRVEAPPVQLETDTKEFVRLVVRDTGCGMSPDIQAHLFEPFFTTKEGAGGLGLAAVFGAIRQHWGWIECTTAEQSGTEFRIYLPCISQDLLPSASEMAATEVVRGTILLVDNDQRSRGVARYILNRNGYRVIEADSPSIAQLLWESQARNVNLLLTDFVLPGGSGFDLANQLRQTRPDLKVIFACADKDGSTPELTGDCLTVSKPYRADALLECVEVCIPSDTISKAESGGTTFTQRQPKSPTT
ncbi:MAG TPA: ATP-binding protein [Verrucomicrobiae bacterium]|nr:ATP-binding protein [Verrucomicrobiae bacterium]